MHPNDENNLSDYLAALRRRRGPAAAVSIVAFLVSMGLAFALPPVYRASATILIEQPEIPKELVRSTITSYAEERIKLIGQRVMNSANLLAIIQKFDLYPERRGDEPIENVFARMREDIVLETVLADVVDPRLGKPIKVAVAFTLSYENRSPQLAQNVANELVSLYLAENIKLRTKSTSEASSFLSEEAEKLATEIGGLEAQLAEFKERNVNQLPELTPLNFQLMERVEQELIEVERQIRSLTEQRIHLGSQLAHLEPRKAIYSRSGEPILNPTERLKFLETALVSASARYSPEHPTLAELRREIEAFKKDTGAVSTTSEIHSRLVVLRSQLSSVRKRYSQRHPDVQRLIREIGGLEDKLKGALASPSESAQSEIDNPAYLEVLARLETADTEIATTRTKALELRGKRASYETRLAQTPGVERQYRDLMRDYEGAIAKYKEVTAKQMEARLAQSLEAEQKGERFTLLEPPRLPEIPAEPQRLAISLLGTLLSLGLGLGTAALAEALDATVRGSEGIVALLGAPPLALIPKVESLHQIHHRTIHRRLAIAGLFTGLALAVMLFHWLVTPVDVLWHSVVGKLELANGALLFFRGT